MSKPIELSKEAKGVLALIASKMLEDENYREELMALDDAGRASQLSEFIKTEFPQISQDKVEPITEEIQAAYDASGGRREGIIELQRRSRFSRRGNGC